MSTEATTLSNDEILRYSRHLIMPEVGMEGQIKLKNAKILLVGAGGLGAPLGLYLAAAGIGKIGIVDFDVVDFTNLQRQVIHGTKDVGRKKLDSAYDSMRDINPNVQIDRYDVALSSENALEIMAGYDMVVDGTDNFPTRYLVNDALRYPQKAQRLRFYFPLRGPGHNIRLSWWTVLPLSLSGAAAPPVSYRAAPEGGVLGILPGIIGLVQATEAVKLALGIGETLVGRLMLYDALAMKFRELKLRRNPECPACGDHPTITKLIDYQQFCGIPQHTPEPEFVEGDITPVEVKAKLDRGDKFQLIDVREPHEYQSAASPARN